MKILIAGDFCQRFRTIKKIENKEFCGMFDAIKPIVNECDVKIVNFEFPIVVEKGKPIKKIGPTLKGTINAVDAIKYAGFNVCTLANNHILDQGDSCCIETKNLLEQNGVSTVGVGSNLNDAGNILYMESEGKKLAIINCCENEFSIATDRTPGANPLNPIHQFYKIKEARKYADFVLVIVHGGIEHYQLPTPRMVENYHFFIDAGADAIVNHHQHCYSGYEMYNGKPIIYGLGNLLFDNPNIRHRIWNEGYMVQINFDEGITFDLHPYTQCNEEPNICLMNEEQKKSFKNKILDLNRIIASPKELIKAFDAYSIKNRKFILSSFTPWTNRLLLAAFLRGLLPAFLSTKRILNIKNRISCESHYDLTMHELKRQNNYNGNI